MTSQRISIYRRNLVQGVGSSAISFGITLFTTPLMTRLFPAEAYGVNGTMLSTTNFLCALGLLGMPVALAREHGLTEQKRLLDASGQLAVCLVAACILGVLVALLIAPSGINRIGGIVLLLPLLIAGQSAQRLSDALVTATGVFPAQAGARVLNAGSARLFALGAGWALKPSVAFMLLGDTLGKLVHVAISAKYGGLYQYWADLHWRPNWRALRATVSRYRDFATHSNLAMVLPLGTTMGIQLLIGLRLGAGATGQYVLAQSILTLPVSLIALATAPIVFRDLVQTADQAPDRLFGQALRVMGGYLAAGTICMLPIMFAGPALFGFFFGETWREAGEAASMLAFPQVLAFSLTGVLSLFRVTRKIRAWFWFELTGAALILGGLSLTHPGNFQSMIALLGGLMVAYQVLMFFGCLYAARPRRHVDFPP